jgi:predicted MFS family arabinose efflux permease/cytidylate kinase
METQNQEKLWTGSFIKICLVNFFVFVNFHALLPTFPFFVTYLGGDAVAIGVATALFSTASIVSRPFIGWLVDTKGRRTLLVAGLIGMSLLPMGYFVATGIAFAVLLRTIHGAFHAASSNAASTWVADIVPRSRMGEGLGMYGLSMAVSTAVAPAMGLYVMGRFGFRPLFAIATTAAVLALLIGLSISDRSYKLSAKPLKISQLFEKDSVPASITQFFFMMAYGVIEVYVAIYAQGNQLPSGGIYFIGIAIATVLTRIATGRVIDRQGEGILVYTGNAAIIVGILLLVFMHNTPCYLASALLLGYSFGAIQPSLQTMSMHIVAPDRRGAASSTFFCAFDFGIAIGGFLAGMLVKHFGYNVMFICISFSCVCSLVYYHLFGRNHRSSMNHKMAEGQPTATVDAGQANLPLVITISREYGSGGRAIGELIAHKMGIRLYDADLIKRTAQESGLSEQFVAANEQMLKSNLLYDLYASNSDFQSGDDPAQTALFYAQSKIIRDLARKEPCVIVGRLANFVLEGQANCFNVFIYADKASRIRRITDSYGVKAEDAAHELERTDTARKEHCRHYTGKVWGKYCYYHLEVDSSKLGDGKTADLIIEATKKEKKLH